MCVCVCLCVCAAAAAAAATTATATITTPTTMYILHAKDGIFFVSVCIAKLLFKH